MKNLVLISPKKQRIAESLKRILDLVPAENHKRIFEELTELAYEIGGIRFMEYCKGLFYGGYM